jgi:ABC-type glycerol-3-phosphate transport system permease component
MGAFGIFRHVVWPTAGPALALLAIILFMATWSEFARPFMPPGSSTPSSSGLGQWPMPVDPQAIAMIVGSSIIATFPVIGLFFFARRSFLRAIPSPPN